MSIETGVLLRTRGEVKRVEINGVPMLGTGDSPGVLSLEWGDSYDQPCWLNVELNTIPDWMRSGMDVKFYAGIMPDNPIQFTGFISALPGEEPEFLRDKIILDGAVITIGTPPDTSESPLNATATLSGADIRPPLPSGSHIAGKYQNRMIWDNTRLSAVALRILTDRGRVPGHPAGDIDSQTIECASPLYNLVRQLEFEDSELDVGGMTDIEVIEREFARCGITDYTIDPPSLGAYTLADDATIDGGSGIDRLQDLVGVASPSGLQFHALPGGTILLREMDFFPAPTAAFEYTTDDPDSAYIMDTSGVTEIAVTFNPTIRKGMTGYFRIPHLNVDGRFFVYGVRHSIPRMPSGDSTNAEGPMTYLRLRGGNRLGGTVGADPVAAFTFSIRRQVVNDRVYLIYTLNGSESVSLTGTITDWDWTISTGAALDPITTQPAHPLSGVSVTFMVDPADIDPDGILTSSLTVTQTDGRTHTHSLQLPISATESAVVIAPFGVAGGIRRSVTPNGGETYNNTTPSSKTATCVAGRPADGVHSGHFAMGHSNGTIDVTRDFGVTYVAATFDIAPGAQFNDIAWDWRNTKVCWAITTDMRLYVCLDMDAATPAFGLYGGAGLRTTLGIAGAIAGRRCIGLPAAGGIYIFGGDGAGVPLIVFDAAITNVWTQVTFTGDLATDTATPADATMRIVDYTAPGDGMEHMILEWASGGGASLVAIYYTTSPPGASRAFSRATGLTAGLKTGRVILSDAPIAGPFLRHAMFADRDTWHTTDGIAWTRTADVLPVGYTPNDGLFESDVLTGLIGMQDVYLVCAENAAGDGGVFKSVGNGFTVLDPIYGAGATYPTPAYPTGAKPKQIAIGAVGSTTPQGQGSIAAILTNASPRTITKLLANNPSWTTPVGVTSTENKPLLRCLTSDLFFVMRGNNNSDDIGHASYRSQDGGETWAANATGLYDVCRAADGVRIWGLFRDTASFTRTLIKWSEDEGDNWTTSLTLGNGTSDNRAGIRIAAHPTNPNIIAAWGLAAGSGASGGGFTAVTDDDGGSWNTDVTGQPNEGQSGTTNVYHFKILQNNRLVWAGFTGGSAQSIQTSDDVGGSNFTWTVRHSDTTAFYIGMDFDGASGVVFRDNTDNSNTHGKPLVTNDSATTWTELSVSSIRAGNGLASTVEADAGCWDKRVDTLYLFAGSGVYAITPLTNAGVWSNVTDSIASGSHGENNMAVIP